MVKRFVGRGGVCSTTATLLLVLSLFNHVNECHCELPEYIVYSIIEACELCDVKFQTFMNDLSMNFTGLSGDPHNSPLEVGNLLTRRLQDISSCYTDCLQGYDYQYTSNVSLLAHTIIGLATDTGCSNSYIPSCYVKSGAQLFSGFRFSTSGCDQTRNTTLASITRCIDKYAKQQNCSGLCTAGQRGIPFGKLDQEIVCQIQLASELCYAEVRLCLEQTYGVSGSDFTSGRSLIGASSDEICNQGRRFSACLENAVSGSATVGTPPCQSLSSRIENIIEMSDAIFKPFCDHPSQNFTSVCALPPKKDDSSMEE